MAYKDMSEKYSEINDVSGFVDFNRPSDIVRSGFTALMVKFFDEEG